MATIVCYGEVLWDVFPTYKTIGGAPLNVALRLHSFKNNLTIISSVGNDEDGKKLLQYIEKQGVKQSYIQVNETYKTGTVLVSLDETKSANYQIVFPCAWDFILPQETIFTIVKNADAFIFGSLVARNKVSFSTLIQLLNVATFKVFDVNLRAPHYTKDTLFLLLQKADFIKFNDAELFEICTYYNFKSLILEDNIRFISNKTKTKNICVTLGGDGAIFFTENKFFKNTGYSVIVKDTVGAGDSFLAALIDKLLKNENPKVALDIACAVGAIVASKEGANAIITESSIAALLNT